MTVSSPVMALTAATGAVYAGGVGGVAVWTEQGWRPRISGLPLTGVAALVSTNDCLVAGGSEGIARTEHGGESWRYVARTGAVSALLELNGVLLAATIGNGILRSDDGGAGWRQHDPGLVSHEVTALALGADGVALAATASGIHWSGDGGHRWQVALGSEQQSVAALAGGTDGTVLAVLETGHLLQSTDSGRSWRAHATLLPAGVEILSIHRLPGTPIYLLGTAEHGLLRSQDGGQTWRSVLAEIVLCFAGTLTTLYAGTARTVIASEDGGLTWRKQLGAPPVHDLRRLTSLPQGVLVSGRMTPAVRYNRDTRGWQPLHPQTPPLPQPLSAVTLTPGGALLASGPGAGLLRTEGARGWQQVMPRDAGHVTQFTFGADGEGWAGGPTGQRLLRTRDDGRTWETELVSWGDLPVVALQSADDFLFAATYAPNAATLQLWLRNLPSGGWQRGAELSTSWPLVASHGRPPILGVANLLFRHDQETGWRRFDLPDNVVVRRLVGTARHLWLLTTGGLFRSKDGGTTWHADSVDLPVEQMMDVALGGDHLYLLLAGGEVWVQNLSQTEKET